MAKIPFLGDEGLRLLISNIVQRFAHTDSTIETVNSTLSSHTDDTNIHVKSDQKTYWDSAYAHSITAHSPSDAEKNIIVGVQKNGTDIVVDSVTRKANVIVPVLDKEDNDGTVLTESISTNLQNQINELFAQIESLKNGTYDTNYDSSTGDLTIKSANYDDLTGNLTI